MASPRVRPTVLMISPDGQEFTPKWAGGTRTVKKRLARYSFAGINGEVVDDYGTEGWVYPMQLIFDGATYDTDAKLFCDTFNAERGQWKVNHPTNGYLGLQGVSAIENDQPISEANATRVDVEFVENLDPVELKTLRNMLIELGMAVNEFNAAQSDRLAATMKMDPASIQEAKESGRSLLESVKKGFAEVVAANAKATEARDNMIGKLNSATIGAASLVSGIQDMVNAPARALADIKARMNILARIGEDLFGSDNDPPYPSYNDSAVKEVSAAAIAAAAASAVATVSISNDDTDDVSAAGVAPTVGGAQGGGSSGLTSRASLLALVDQVNEVFSVVRAGMDAEAQKYDDEYLEDTYVPLGSTAPILAKVEALTHLALQTQFFSLPTEIRVVTRQDTSIFALAMKYHGTVGENDYYLKQIINENGLKGSEILYVPPGREIVIYGAN